MLLDSLEEERIGDTSTEHTVDSDKFNALNGACNNTMALARV
jgi:hypothetical protein